MTKKHLIIRNNTTFYHSGGMIRSVEYIDSLLDAFRMELEIFDRREKMRPVIINHFLPSDNAYGIKNFLVATLRIILKRNIDININRPMRGIKTK